MTDGWALAFPFATWTSAEIPPDVEANIFLDAEILQQSTTKFQRFDLAKSFHVKQVPGTIQSYDLDGVLTQRRCSDGRQT